MFFMSESFFRVPVSWFNIGGRQGRFLCQNLYSESLYAGLILEDVRDVFMSESLFRVPISWFNIGGRQGRFLCQNLYSESL